MKLLMISYLIKINNGVSKWYSKVKIECKYTILLKSEPNKDHHLMLIVVFPNSLIVIRYLNVLLNVT